MANVTDSTVVLGRLILNGKQVFSYLFESIYFRFLSGMFHLIVQFPNDYPTRPPNVRFLSKMFHPNST